MNEVDEDHGGDEGHRCDGIPVRILITGGAGFIGSHAAAHLAGLGHEIRVLDDFSTGCRENLDGIDVAHLTVGDVADPDCLEANMTGCDAVIHLAAYVSVPGSIAKPVESARTNIGGTVAVLAQAARSGVGRVIFASSAAVYGEPVRVPLDEEHPTVPISPYGAHKLAGEHLCRIASLTGGLDTVVFRFFNVYGPRQDPASDYAAVIPVFRDRCTRGERPRIHGDGTQTRDFVHVSDVVEAIGRSLERDESFGGIPHNLARGEATTIDALARSIMANAEVQGSPVYGPPREGDIAHSVAMIDRLRATLGWSPRIGLEEGLKLG